MYAVQHSHYIVWYGSSIYIIMMIIINNIGGGLDYVAYAKHDGTVHQPLHQVPSFGARHAGHVDIVHRHQFVAGLYLRTLFRATTCGHEITILLLLSQSLLLLLLILLLWSLQYARLT